jgi:acyl-CoA thioesterase
MSAPAPPLDPSFASATALVPDGDGRYLGHYGAEWSSLRGVHGGYQAAIATRAAAAADPERSVRTVAASFLRPGAVGPVVLDVAVVRRTRTFTTTVVTASQGDRPVLTLRTTAVAAVDGHDWATAAADRPASLEDAVAFTPPPEIPHFHQADLRLDPATVPTSDGSEARIAGYIRPHAGTALDTPWLVMAGDWFPPSPFRRVALPIGGVSIDYTVHLHRLPGPDDEWLSGVFTTANSSDGLALEHGVLATLDATVVAETFHTRWTG